MSSLASILRAEWLKLKHYKPFWVLVGLYPICLGGVLAVGLWIQAYAAKNIPQGGAALAANPIFGFPRAWQTVAWIASWMQFLPALLIILNVSNEFTFRSHRQNLLEGWSRVQFMGAKLLLAGSLTLYCGANVALFTLIAAACSGFAPSPEGLQFLAYFLVQTLVYSVFALFVAFLIRRAALALAAFLIYSAILERLLAFFINLKLNGFGNFLPLRVADELLPAPYFREAVQNAAKHNNLFDQPANEALLVAAVIYLLLFVGLMGFRFQREDL